MSEFSNQAKERENDFNKEIVRDYLKYGSVDEVFRRHNYNLPISYPGVHRLINKWGIVKAAGPNSKLSEAITFFMLLSDRKIPLETLYRSMPPSFRTSMGTLHRILHNIKEGVARRVGTALVVTPAGGSELILTGEDVSTPRLEVGKPFGSISLPMGYSKKDEDPKTSILRVLQQEVFAEQAVARKMPTGLISNKPKPFMFVDIADVRVAVFNINLPRELGGGGSFTSYKLRNFSFKHFTEIIGQSSIEGNFRVGMKEIALGYKKYLEGAPGFETDPFVLRSFLNISLAELAYEYQER